VRRAPSFRDQLAVRFASTAFLLITAVSVVAYLALRLVLFQELDRTIRTLASIEVAATTDGPGEHVHFHEQVFLTQDPGSTTILSRYAEFWTVEGEAVLRTRNLESKDLPLSDEIRERVTRTGTPEFFGFEWGGQGFRSILYPLSIAGPQHEMHLLQVAASTKGVARVLAETLRLLAVLVGVGTVVAAGLGWWLAGHAVRPVVEIAEQAETMAAGASPHRLSVSVAAGTEEFGRLVQVLNSMLSRIDDLLEGQRRFLADAGHSIRTPLTILRGDLEVTLRKDRDVEEYRGTLAQALSDLRTVSSLADDLITLARSAGGELRPREGDDVDLATLLDGLRAKFEGVASDQGVAIDVQADGQITIGGDIPLLERALSNLLDNALKYGVPSGGTIRLRARRSERGRIEISIRDSGSGIPRDEVGSLFDRFYRGESHRRTVAGSGLGLAIVRAVIEGRGGRVEVRTSEAGTTFQISLPV